VYWRELNTGLYPWDLHDEGIERILDNLEATVGCNAVYMTALMHSEKRPLHDNTYPHNPVRKRYLTEDAVAYWKPDPDCYRDSRIKPATTERPFLKGTDWVRLFVDAVRKRGLKAGVAISHTPLSEARAVESFADCIQRDVYGSLLPVRRLGKTSFFHAQQLCWNSPDARKYIEALVTDLVSHYPVDIYQVSNLLMEGGAEELHPLLGVTLGGCFCANCEREARARGLDWDAITKTVRRYADVMSRSTVAANEEWLLLKRGDSSPVMLLLEHRELYEWLQFRCETITAYFRGLSAAVHKARPDIDFRFNTNWPGAEYIGLDLTKIAPFVDSVRMTDYAEQTGDVEKVRRKGKWLSNVRRQVGEDMTLISSIAPRGKATPELIKLGVKTIAENDADGLSFAFYDGAKMQYLRAIREAMDEAEITLVSK
jgi:hypothetical protein